MDHIGLPIDVETDGSGCGSDLACVSGSGDRRCAAVGELGGFSAGLVPGAPRKRRRLTHDGYSGPAGTDAFNRPVVWGYQSASGYFYEFKVAHGRVMFYVGDESSGLRLGDGWCNSMSLSDWAVFRGEICHELNRRGTEGDLYITQWFSNSDTELFRIYANRFVRDARDFILIRSCRDRTRIVADPGHEAWDHHPYPIGAQIVTWLKDFFVIKWADWFGLQSIFSKIDEEIEISEEEEEAVEAGISDARGVRRCLFYDDMEPCIDHQPQAVAAQPAACSL